MIRVSDTIPNISTMHKQGTKTEWLDTHALFENKRVLLVGIPGLFLVEYAASQLRTIDFYADRIKDLGIDEIYFTSVDDCYAQKAYLKLEGITKIKNLPDPTGIWAEKIGMLEDMSKEGLGKHRSHRYAMFIDNLKMKSVKYEDFSHNPMTCFQVTDADSIIKYLEVIQTNYERWSNDKTDNIGRDKINSVLS